MKFNLPVILLKSLVILPFQEVRIELNNSLSKKAVSYASKYHENKVLVVCPIDQMEEEPDVNDLPKIGVVGKIKTKIELPNGNLRIVIKGLERVDIVKYSSYKEDKDILESENIEIELVKYDPTVKIATLRKLFDVLDLYIKSNHNISNSIVSTVRSLDDLEKVTDIITSFLPFSISKKLSYMNEVNAIKRAESLIEDLNIEVEVIALEEKIDSSLKEKFESQEREIIIKEKIKELNDQLGNCSTKTDISTDYYDKLDKLNIGSLSKKKILNEIKRFDFIPENSPEISIIRSYIDWILDLPWNISTKDNTDLDKVKKTLDKNHYGLLEAKEIIIEYIAAKNVNKDINAPIICLVGPPGVGKTTFAMSIAESLNRKFCKISVGGLNDSSELIGHSRTYLGALPGKIIQGIKKANSNNPVFLIDEVDKLVKDYKGDPASVLLDILDKEQNNSFIDAYIEEPFDLSNVLFVLTANTLDTVPEHLKDRLEIIHINSYADFEKVDIIKKHIFPKILSNHNLVNKIKIQDKAILSIINNYTNEAGLREIERKLTSVVRKSIINNYNDLAKINVNVKDSDIEKYLGKSMNNVSEMSNDNVGTINAIGINKYGGILLKLECKLIPGNGENAYTGNLDDDLKEGIQVAQDYIFSNKDIYKIDLRILKDKYIHIHFSNSTIKKSGLSGGIAITSAIMSVLKNKPIKNDISFTGEITLNGDIIKVGDIREKIIVSYNNKINKIYIPYGNKDELDDIPKNIKDHIEIILVKNYSEIYKDLF